MKFNSIRTEEDTVFVSLVGPQPPAVAADMLAHFRHAVERVSVKYPKVYVHVDLSGVTLKDVSSDARLAMKEAFALPFYRLAAVGHNHMMEVAMYLMKSGGAADRARYFTSERSAREWLKADADIEAGNRLNAAVLVAGQIVSLIGLSSLVGWAIGNEYLTRWFTYVRPINPMASVGLMLLGMAVTGLWAGKKRLAMVGTFGAVLLGILALLPLNIDFWLFGNAVRATAGHVQLADSAAVCFILAGLALWMLEMQRRKLQSIMLSTIGVIIVAIAAVNMVGQLYGQGWLYGISPTFGMAFNLATAFALTGILVLVAVTGRKLDALRQGIGVMGWLTIVALILVQVATFASWRQAIDRNRNEAWRDFIVLDNGIEQKISDRTRAYIDALHGYRGLFASSEFVGQNEFQTYYDSVRLNQNYPGLRSLVYISRVPDSMLRKTAASPGSLIFVPNSAQAAPLIIKKPINVPVHYVVTYIAGTSNSSVIGNDISGDTSRAQAFERAEKSGEAVSSGSIELAPSPSFKGGQGFFITLPVANESGSNIIKKPAVDADKYTGFVGAVFQYDVFFDSLFSDSTLLHGVNVTIKDGATGSVVYRGQQYDGATPFVKTTSVAMADSEWHVTLQAPESYGVSSNQRNLPASIIVAGQVLSALLIMIFVMLYRSSRNALRLADTITVDLQHERNLAVGLQQKDDAILSSIGDAVFALDGNGRLTLFNPAAEQVSGYRADEVIGKPYDSVLKFFYAKDDTPNKDFINEARAGHLSSMKNHTYLLHKDGHRVAVADSAAPIRDSAGAMNGIIVVFRDVSREEELDRAKTEFVSLASHQLRTPLSAINWYSEMLLDDDSGKLNKDQREYAQEIFNGNQRMVELVNALLDVSRLDLGKLKSEPTPLNLPELTDSVIKELAPSIKLKRQTVIDKVDRKLPMLSLDPKLLRMVVQNLLSNAVKYTPDKGTVTLVVRDATAAEIRKAKCKPGREHVILQVTDTGYGIPKKQQASIFGKLFRADNVRKLDVEGTGLGLYIVKEVASKLGGAVWFESIEGKGTSFYVVVPKVVSDPSEHV